MAHIHKKFSTEQVKILLTSYQQGHITRSEIEKTLGIGKTRFFALLKQLNEDPQSFSIDYQRRNKPRLSIETEEKIKFELLRE
jgi:predicted DNA-binding ArsR family transcriptional regulator